MKTQYTNSISHSKKLHTVDIKRQLTPLDFYRHALGKTSFKRPSWNEGGLCPFHSDNKPGSFHVNLITGAYKCFACNAAGGDVIAFTMTVDNLSFPEAVNKLADDWGLL